MVFSFPNAHPTPGAKSCAGIPANGTSNVFEHPIASIVNIPIIGPCVVSTFTCQWPVPSTLGRPRRSHERRKFRTSKTKENVCPDTVAPFLGDRMLTLGLPRFRLLTGGSGLA